MFKCGGGGGVCLRGESGESGGITGIGLVVGKSVEVCVCVLRSTDLTSSSREVSIMEMLEDVLVLALRSADLTSLSTEISILC